MVKVAALFFMAVAFWPSAVVDSQAIDITEDQVDTIEGALKPVPW